MFRIYITAKALADVCLQEQSKTYSEQSAWFHILCKQKAIYTIGYTPPITETLMEDDLSDSGIITTMFAAYNINIIPKDRYIKAVLRDYSQVYQQPNAAFILDLSPAEAKKIQEEYGIICQSTSTPIDTSVFTEECVRFEFVNHRLVSGGWKELFEVPSSIPSNSLCIIDRFLFSNDGQNNSNTGYETEVIYNGLDTLHLILHNALPPKFGNTYNVTIICEKKQIKNRLIFQTLQQKIFDIVYNISKLKGYSIFSQLIAIDGDVAKYSNSLTHNRQIISNYYKISFPNGVDAILFYNGSQNKAHFTQSVQGELLYCTGLRHPNSQCPEDSIAATQLAFKRVLQRWKEAYEPGHIYEPDHYFYADNWGNSSILNFQNRLFS